MTEQQILPGASQPPTPPPGPASDPRPETAAESTTSAESTTVTVDLDTSSTAAFLQSIRAAFSAHFVRPDTDTAAIDALQELTRLGNQVDAHTAIVTSDLKKHRTAKEQAAGVPKADRGKGLSGEISKATKTTPGQAGEFLGFAENMIEHMPNAFEAMLSGEENQDNLKQVHRKLKGSTEEQIEAVDDELADSYGTMTGKQLAGQAVDTVNRIDPDQAIKRAAAARAKRFVNVTPDSDGMVRINGLLPSDEAQMIDQTLERSARSLKASGQTAHPDDPAQKPRTHDQLRADLFTHIFAAGAYGPQPDPAPEPGTDDPEPGTDDPKPGTDDPAPDAPKRTFPGNSFGPTQPVKVPKRVEILLLMTQDAFFGLTDDPVKRAGEGYLPAEVIRKQLAHEDLDVFITRLFTAPDDKNLVRMESRSRAFPKALRKLLFIRDNRCANPFCDNPIDVIDHITRHADGGATSYANGRGLCASCNQMKENRGWKTIPHPDGSVTEIMPTGHTFRTRPPTGWALTGPSGRGDPPDSGDASDSGDPPEPPPEPPALSAGEYQASFDEVFDTGDYPPPDEVPF